MKVYDYTQPVIDLYDAIEIAGDHLIDILREKAPETTKTARMIIRTEIMQMRAMAGGMQ